MSTNFFQDVSIQAFVRGRNALSIIKAALSKNAVPLIMGALALVIVPAFTDVAMAQQIRDLAEGGWTDNIRAVANFAIVLFGLGGMFFVASGIKMVYDKSKERSDVSAGRIFAAFLGGGGMLAISFVIGVLAATLSDGSAQIGEQLQF